MKPMTRQRASEPTRSKRDLEGEFLRYLQLLAPELPPPERHKTFHPTRKWQVDFLWREERLVVEVEGGQFIRGRHQRPLGFAEDCTKYNELTRMGIRLLRFTTSHFDDPAGMIAIVRQTLGVTRG